MGNLRPDLVPFKKAVVDISKGTILRTYYIRPERLAKIASTFKQEPIKKYVQRIDNYDDLKRTLNNGDISGMRNLFPTNNTSTWDNIVARSKVKDSIYENNPSYYHTIKTNQFATSFILSTDNVYLDQFKNSIRESLSSYSFDNTETIKQQNFNKKNLKLDNSNHKYNFEFTLPEKFQKMFDELEKKRIDTDIDISNFGKVQEHSLKYRLKNYKNSVSAGERVSKFLNFMFPKNIKVTQLISKLITKNYRDNNFLVHNLILLPELYESTEFSELLISSIIYDINQTELKEQHDVINTNWNVYRYLLLKELSPDRYKQIISTYKNEKVTYINETYLSGNANLLSLVSDDKLLIEEKSSILLMVGKDILFKYLANFVLYMNAGNNFDNVWWILDSLVCRKDIDTNLIMKILIQITKNKNIHIFEPEYLINEIIKVQMGDDNPTFMYFIFQILSGKKLNIQYIPYDSIGNIKGFPYSSFVINKMLKDVDIIISSSLNSYIKNNTLTNDGVTKLYMPIIEGHFLNDKQIFKRIEPITVLVDDNRNLNNYIEVNVKNSALIVKEYNDKKYYLAFDLLKNIIS